MWKHSVFKLLQNTKIFCLFPGTKILCAFRLQLTVSSPQSWIFHWNHTCIVCFKLEMRFPFFFWIFKSVMHIDFIWVDSFSSSVWCATAPRANYYNESIHSPLTQERAFVFPNNEREKHASTRRGKADGRWYFRTSRAQTDYTHSPTGNISNYFTSLCSLTNHWYYFSSPLFPSSSGGASFG